MATDTMSKVEQVNELLKAGEKGEINNISVDTYGGYIGYQPQSIVDAMNSVFGLGCWGFKELSSEDKDGLVVAKIEVWIAGVEFRPEAWGQSKITRGDVGDARKGAQTDGMKKALSYFSVGNRAYLGLLEDPKKASANNGARQNQQANNQRQNTVPRQATATPAARSAQATTKPAQEAPKTAAPAERLTYRAVYKAGKEKGLWEAANGFYAFASHELGSNVNDDTVKNLAMPNLEKIMKAVQEEKPVAKAS